MPLDPEIQPLLDMMNETPLPDPTTTEPAVFRSLMAAIPVENPTPVAEVSDSVVPGPAHEIPVRIYQPAGAGPHPLLMYFHGGGWVLCDLDTHDELCRQLCNGIDAVVVSVDYRLAPEAKFPAAPEDCYAATCWAVEQAAQWQADGSRLCVAGDSAGGNLAAAVSLMARDQDGPTISHQLLIYPVTERNFDTPSYTENGDGYYLTRDMMQWFWDHYLANDEQASDPIAAPLHGNLAGLPTATVITAEYDPLRDEGIAFAEALQAAGVDVEHRLFEGMIHGFVALPVPLTQGAAALDYLCQRARQSLSN
jgi:acetyl esterase